jgi:hypothetical protein
MVPLPNGKDLHAVGRVCSKLRAAAMRPFRLPARLILEINVAQFLPGTVSHDKAGGLFLDGPRWREAAFGHVSLSKNGGRWFIEFSPQP